MSEFLSNAKRILKLARKPARSEFWAAIKIGFIGLVVMGTISYMIQLIMAVITTTWR